LIQPTIDEIESILQASPAVSTLYLQGDGISEVPPERLEDNYAKAVMIDERMQHDTYIMKRVESLLKKRIDRAKIGVLNVSAHWSIIAGDPVALCQHMGKQEVTGVLKAGEFYNQYWKNNGAEKIAVFRAPMTCHNSALVRNVSQSDEAERWYRYMPTITILNAWDTSCHALCGADCDGDTVLTTDNYILINRHKELPAILCAQSNATKIIPTEKDIVESNIRVFGSNVGAITNRGTSRLTLIEKFPVGSKEREILEYRLSSCQLLQQECIDSVKNAVLQPESRKWYVRSAILKSDMSDADKELYLSICSDKRPYFFRYIYPRINKEYNSYVLGTKKKSLRLFRKEIDELRAQDPETLTDDERKFLEDYERYDPVLEYPCVMNRICWAVEDRLDHFVTKHKDDYEFDYTIMKSGVEYTKTQYSAISQLYSEYRDRLSEFVKFSKKNKVNQEEANIQKSVLKQEFIKLCFEKCSNEEVLCDIMLDMCYRTEKSKSFVWDMCGEQIIQNLLKKNDYMINVPVRDDNGDIRFKGRTYRVDRVPYIQEEEEITYAN